MSTDLHEVESARVSVTGAEAETVFVFAHPSTSYLDTFLTESLEWHGAGVVGVDNRYVAAGDAELDFLTAAEDVARAIEAVVPPDRELVLVGHSGGGPLMGLVQARFRIADALVLLAAHPSRAALFEAWIDPAVQVNGARDPQLDLFAEGRELPLAPSFLERYRAGQAERVRRVAAEAAAHLRAGRGDAKLSVPGLCADPRFVDHTLDPNQRGDELPFGEPREVNARPGFFADGVSARSFFDQWYGPTTPADLARLLPAIDVPVLSVAFGADPLVFPSQSLQIATALPAGNTAWTLEGATHNPKAQPDHLDALSRRMLAWWAHSKR